MNKNRLEAFSDGVLAIIITIMVLELKVPGGTDLRALRPVLPDFGTYVLSFVLLGIYWNNHHHMFQAAREVNGGILWANLHLLFWLTLFPVVTAWAGDHATMPWPVACYGAVQLLAGAAYFILARALVAHHGRESRLARALGDDLKGKASLAAYALAVPLAFVTPWISWALYVAVAVVWLVPDPRIEKEMNS